MFKVKILKASTHAYDWYDSRAMFYPAAGDWQLVNAKEKRRIESAIQLANSSNKSSSQYIMIEYYEHDDDLLEEIYENASAFAASVEDRNRKDEQRKEVAKRQKEERSLARKKKQLEKLKKELGDAE